MQQIKRDVNVWFGWRQRAQLLCCILTTIGSFLHRAAQRLTEWPESSFTGDSALLFLISQWFQTASLSQISSAVFNSADVLNRFKVSVCASVPAGCEGAITHSGWGKRQRRQLEEGGRVNLQIAGPKEISTPQLKRNISAQLYRWDSIFSQIGQFHFKAAYISICGVGVQILSASKKWIGDLVSPRCARWCTCSKSGLLTQKKVKFTADLPTDLARCPDYSYSPGFEGVFIRVEFSLFE